MQVFLFPDTNVFLHFRFFDEVDWTAQLGLEELTLVLTQAVLSELDEHKWSGTRREKSRAQKVLKRLDALDLSTTPTALRPGVSVMALDSEPGDALFVQYRLSAQVGDDRLVASVLDFRAAATGRRAVILTNDTGLRVKARSRRLEVIAPPEALRSEEEPDETERELEKKKRELAEALSAAPELCLSFETGGDHMQLGWSPFADFDPAVLARLLREWRERHPRERAQEDVEFPDGAVFPASMFETLPGYLSPKDAAKRNKQIDRVFGEYEAYLRAWPEALNAFGRCFELRLVLENSGTGPADDVDVRLRTGAPGRWLDERPEVSGPPQVPKPPDRFEFLRVGSLRPIVPDIDISGLRRYDHPIDGPNISDDDEEPAEVQWTVRRVKHHVPVVLPAVFFQFQSTESVASFNVDVRLVAANMRKPRTDVLHVEVIVGERRAPPSPDILEKTPNADSDENGSQ